MWITYALASAFFAAMTTILAKIGIEGINSNLATAIRTTVILLITWGIVFASGIQGQTMQIPAKSWYFLIGSGIATGLSWLFYFKALQIGDASRVAPVDKFSIVITVILAFLLLHEAVSWKVIGGCVLITAGTVLMIL